MADYDGTTASIKCVKIGTGVQTRGFQAKLISTFVVAVFTCQTPSLAKQASPDQIMQATGECVYIVNVAESNGSRLNHSSEKWAELLLTFSERYKLDAKKYVDKAKAKYRKRAKVLGADKALSDMLHTARTCDKQLEGI